MLERNIICRLNEDIVKRARVDVKDEKILSLLSANSRTPISAIAKKVRLSKEGTFYRIKKLKESGLISSFCPVFDLRDLGYGTYHVFMVINEIDPERIQELISHFISHPNTKSVMEYSDRWDIEWVLVARSVQDFDNIVTDLTRDFSDIINEKNNFEIIIGYKSIQFPDPFYGGNVILEPKKKVQCKIDNESVSIIKKLCDDSRLSTYKIAENMDLSPDTVGYRIKKICDAGIIRQFTILPNLSLLGYHWYTMCMNVRTFDLRHEMKFKEYISTKPNIIRAVKLLGDWDIMIHIVTKEVAEMHKIVKDIHRNFVDIIVNYQAWGAYKEHYFTNLPGIVFQDIIVKKKTDTI